MSALFLLVVVIALLIVVPPLARMEQRLTDAQINECLRRIRMHE